MRTTGPNRAWQGALLVVVAGLLAGAATGINMNQVRTAAPGAVNVGGVAAGEGSSLAAARADHAHSLTGVLPVANGGTGNSSGQAATAAGLAGTSGSASSSTFLRGDWSWQAPPAQDWSVITGKPATFTPVDATAAVTGGVRLTGDLGGTAASPTVPGLASKVGTGRLISTTAPLSGGGDLSADRTLSVADAAAGAKGVIQLAGQLSGTAASPTVVGVTGAVVGVSNLSATGTPSATTYLRGDGTWSTPAGGGGSPGGSSGQLQYNNAGSFGGMSRVTTDGGDLIVTGTTVEPAAPASGLLKLYGAQPHGSAGPVLPFWKGGTTQVDYRLFPEMRSADPVWGCLQPGAHGSTTITPAGSIIAGGATGTPAAVSWAATDERTRAKWVQYPSATTASSSAGLRAGVDYVWRGNAAGLGGWYTWGSFSIVTTTANQRLFVGLKDAVAVITATTNPSAALDTVYFGCDAAQTTIRICSNDNAGAATCTDLGASFPCTTANIAYDWALWAQPNGSSIGYYIRRLVNGSEAQGTISTDLPRNTVALGWDFWINNGGTAAASTLQFGGVCYVANP